MGALAAGLLLLLGAARPFFVTPTPDGTPWADGVRSIIARLRQQSGNRIQLKAMHGAIAGSETETARQCFDGGVVMWGGTIGALANLVPELAVFELPYLFDSDAEVDAVLGGAVRADLDRLLGAHGVTVYGVVENGWRHFAGGKPLRRPEDFQRLPVRSQPNPMHLEMWRLLGARPRPLEITETLAALETGLLKGFDQSPAYMFATSWYRAATHYTLSHHIHQAGLVLVCKGALDGFSKTERVRILAGAAEETRAVVVGVRALTREILEHLGKEGMTLVELTPEERRVLRDRIRPVYQTLRKHEGSARLLDKVEAALRRLRGKR